MTVLVQRLSEAKDAIIDLPEGEVGAFVYSVYDCQSATDEQIQSEIERLIPEVSSVVCLEKNDGSGERFLLILSTKEQIARLNQKYDLSVKRGIIGFRKPLFYSRSSELPKWAGENNRFKHTFMGVKTLE